MKKLLCILLICVPSLASAAQQMRDFSMPVDQSLQNANSAPSKPTQGWNNNTYKPNSYQDQNDGSYVAPEQNKSTHFMDHYCDPNTRIGIAKTSLTSCIQDKRKTACDEYASLPADARAVINVEIDCQSRNENVDDFAETPDEDEEETTIFKSKKTKTAQPAGCEDAAEKRIEQLKKHHGDAYVSHALLFLPDMVFKASGACASGR